jgi:hypothetical protein
MRLAFRNSVPRFLLDLEMYSACSVRKAYSEWKKNAGLM